MKPIKNNSKRMENQIDAIAQEVFGFSLESMGCDGYDFFENDRGTLSVGSLQAALEKAYLAGMQNGGAAK